MGYICYRKNAENKNIMLFSYTQKNGTIVVNNRVCENKDIHEPECVTKGKRSYELYGQIRITDKK